MGFILASASNASSFSIFAEAVKNEMFSYRCCLETSIDLSLPVLGIKGEEDNDCEIVVMKDPLDCASLDI